MRRIAGLVLVVAAVVLYVSTLDNGLQSGELLGGDLITHQYAQVQARPSNAPGYPLYTLGGWAWFHGVRGLLRQAGVNYPDPIPILSSYSTVWAVLALWLLFEIICLATEAPNRPGGNWPVALFVASFYAVTYFFWYYATTTEQYSSAIAHTLAILLAFLVWMRRREDLRLLFLLAFLCGLSLAHMLTVAFVVPPIVAAVLWENRRLVRQPKAIAGSVVAAMLPLLAYIWVYVRGSRHPEWWGSHDFDSPANWFWSFVSTAQGREELMWAFEPGRPLLGNGFPELMIQELSWPVLLAGVAGIAFLRRPLPFVLYATLALYMGFSWAYRFGNWFQVIMPAYALLLVGVGASADRWESALEERRNAAPLGKAARIAGAILASLPLALLAVATIWRFGASLPAADSRGRPGDNALIRPAILLSSQLPEGSAVFAPVEDALGIQYLGDIWGLRPDVRVVGSREAAALLRSQPVFSTLDGARTLVEEIAQFVRVQPVVVSPDWVLVPPAASTNLDAAQYWPELQAYALDGLALDEVSLIGYELAPSPSGEPVIEDSTPAFDIVLTWRLRNGTWPEGLSVSVRPTVGHRFVAAQGDPGAIVQSDRSLPVQLALNAPPTDADVVIRDPFRVQFPDDAASGDVGIAVILYRTTAAGFEDVARLDLPLPTDGSTSE